MRYDFDFSKLKGRMKEKSMTQEDLAKQVGISTTTLGYKLSGKVDFKLKEALVISKVLDISPAEYFFCLKS